MSSFVGLLLLLLAFSLTQARAESVFDRFENEETNEPLFPPLSASETESDAIAGPRSKHFVGTFRGQPILTRQRQVYVDNEGVPVPVRR
ncbi:unnamed protein product [Angiostrongylus costaricensis]|uniref:Uncharacterized protein n=1 Tax=Angiostrongylus costaricensis TaxID=334426 RepID=A0A0R3PKK7_ANGCS|nr:unnamed protein product [Angiostrongylus costaricensis]